MDAIRRVAALRRHALAVLRTSRALSAILWIAAARLTPVAHAVTTHARGLEGGALGIRQGSVEIPAERALGATWPREPGRVIALLAQADALSFHAVIPPLALAAVAAVPPTHKHVGLARAHPTTPSPTFAEQAAGAVGVV